MGRTPEQSQGYLEERMRQLLGEHLRDAFGEVTRLEIIRHDTNSSGVQGREVIFWDPRKKIETSIQDEGRTLKIFVTDREVGNNAEDKRPEA